MMTFFKKNPVLAVGIFLPVLLMLLFLVASGLPAMYVDPPKYNLIFTSKNYGHNDDYVETRFRVVNKQLVAEYRRRDKQTYNQQALYIFDTQADSVRRIEFDMPAGDNISKNTDWQRAEIKELEGIKLDTSTKAPDGYEFAPRSYRGADVTGLFYRSRKRTASIRKDGRVVDIPQFDTRHYYSYDLAFLGWVKP